MNRKRKYSKKYKNFFSPFCIKLKQKKYLNFHKFLKIWGLFKLKSLRKKRHVLNSQNIIDAWFAGFFLGDGSIESKTQKGRLNLAKKDIFLLRFICKHFGFPRRRVKNYGHKCRLNFSKKFIQHLCQIYNISQQKSFGIVSFPHFLKIPQIKAFLLGLLYADGNVRIKLTSKSPQFAVRFLQSWDFCCELLLWIQENSGFYTHYNETSISRIATKNPNYDLAGLELAGIDSVKLVRWLLEDSDGKIPILERKLKVLLNLDITKIKAQKKVFVGDRFTNKEKRTWTQEEVEQLKTYLTNNPTHTDEMIGTFLKRTARAVQHKRTQLKIQRTTKVQKTPNTSYSKEEFECIKETLKNTSNRSSEMLLDLVESLNKLPSNAGKSARTVRGVRTYIQKHFDNQEPT